jgi:hypothetical protein
MAAESFLSVGAEKENKNRRAFPLKILSRNYIFASFLTCMCWYPHGRKKKRETFWLNLIPVRSLHHSSSQSIKHGKLMNERSSFELFASPFLLFRLTPLASFTPVPCFCCFKVKRRNFFGASEGKIIFQKRIKKDGKKKNFIFPHIEAPAKQASHSDSSTSQQAQPAEFSSIISLFIYKILGKKQHTNITRK